MKLIKLALVIAIFAGVNGEGGKLEDGQMDAQTSAIFEREVDKFVRILEPYQSHIQQATIQADSPISLLTCSLCSSIIPAARSLLTLPRWLITPIAVKVCEILNLAPRSSICEPIVTAYVPQMVYILTDRVDGEHKGYEICGMLLNDCDPEKFPALNNWNVSITGEKPDVSPDRHAVSASMEPTVTFLQFTDIHMDLNYSVGSNPQCGAGVPICCRLEEGRPEVNTPGAGPFGDFMCALPESAYTAMLADSKRRYPQTKYVFLTGDYIHSGVWLYSVEENKRVISKVIADTIEAYQDTNVQIYPITGNHEPHVVNMYIPKEQWTVNDPAPFDLGWLYHTVMDPFVQMQPSYLDEVDLETFYDYGYYTVSPEKGLRFVFINTNLAYTENYWLAFSTFAKDPGGMLEWMEKVLHAAEEANEAVYIIGHVEPGDCLASWSVHYNRIINRYEGIIQAMMFGHSHKPQYRMHFSEANETLWPISIIAGSALTDGMNPSYSAYRVDGATDRKSWELLRHEMIILKLAESNEEGTARFEKLIDSLEDFELDGVNGKSVLEMGKKMVCDQDMIDAYIKFHHKGEDSNSWSPCNTGNVTCLLPLLSDFGASNKNNTDGMENFLDYVRYTECKSGSGTFTVNLNISIIIGCFAYLYGKFS